MKLHPFQLSLNCLAALALTMSCTYADEAHWSYSGDDGPEHWGSLDESWQLCSSGKNQSPIDLGGAINATLPELAFNWANPEPTDEVNNGHTIQVNLNSGNYMTISDRRFNALQYHFHSPSEHLIDGQSFPMEVHIVHADDAGNLAVVGIMFQLGERNPALDLLPSFRAPGLPPTSETVDYKSFITNQDEYFSYNGSLTTPPCSEGVKWTVLKTPVTASTDQIQRFFDIWESATNRPIQPQNARSILE